MAFKIVINSIALHNAKYVTDTLYPHINVCVCMKNAMQTSENEVDYLWLVELKVIFILYICKSFCNFYQYKNVKNY